MRTRWTQLRERGAAAIASASSGGAPARAETAGQLRDLRARLRRKRVQGYLTHRLHDRWTATVEMRIGTAAKLAAGWVTLWILLWLITAAWTGFEASAASWGELTFTAAAAGAGVLAVFIAYRAYEVATRAYEAALVAPAFEMIVSGDDDVPGMRLVVTSETPEAISVRAVGSSISRCEILAASSPTTS